MTTYNESITRILNVLEKINREIPFDGLRWAIDHAETVTPQNIQRIKALGGGVAIQSRLAFAGEYFQQRYGEVAAEDAPPLRELLESGVPLGAGSDATRVSNYNPWTALHWMVTGQKHRWNATAESGQPAHAGRGPAALHTRQFMVFRRGSAQGAHRARSIRRSCLAQ